MSKHWLIPGIMLFLSLISILILRSVAPQLLGRQVLYFFIGAGVFWFSSRLTFQQWLSLRWYLYTLLVGGLILTQLVATVTRGTKSWIAIGPFHAQPSQLAVAIMGLLLGYLLTRKVKTDFIDYIKTVSLIAVPAGLIFLEPDLGTTVIYVLAMGAALMFSQVPLKYLASTAVLGVGLLIVAWLFLLKSYQKQRITSFIDAGDTQQSASYNAIQSIIAVGSGGLAGKGLGQGTQSHLRFLPERQTDFVFASFAEETGFIGGVLVISLYASLIGICFYAAITSSFPAAQVFAVITGVMFLAQVGVNIGMNIGLMPITGITLPFISYGGSSILALSFQLGILHSILGNMKQKAKMLIQ